MFSGFSILCKAVNTDFTGMDGLRVCVCCRSASLYLQENCKKTDETDFNQLLLKSLMLLSSNHLCAGAMVFYTSVNIIFSGKIITVMQVFFYCLWSYFIGQFLCNNRKQ